MTTERCPQCGYAEPGTYMVNARSEPRAEGLPDEGPDRWGERNAVDPIADAYRAGYHAALAATPPAEGLRGYWTVDSSEFIRPDIVDKIKDRLLEATAHGKQIVTAEGITLTWHDATTPPAEGLTDWYNRIMPSQPEPVEPRAEGLDVERLADDVRYAGAVDPSDYWRGFNDGINGLVERVQEALAPEQPE